MCIITQDVINLVRMDLGMVSRMYLGMVSAIFSFSAVVWSSSCLILGGTRYPELCGRVVLRQISMLPRAVNWYV